MTTRREFVGTVGAVAAASLIPFKFTEAEPFFDMATMETTHVYPLSTPLKDLWHQMNFTYEKAVLDELDAWRLTQVVVDYLQKESIEAYLIDCPSVMIAGKLHYAKTRKLRCRWESGEVGMEELGWEFAYEVKGRAAGDEQWGGEPRSVGILGFGATPLAGPEAFCQRRGLMVRYLISKTPAREVLRLAELTKRNNIPPSSYKWTNA